MIRNRRGDRRAPARMLAPLLIVALVGRGWIFRWFVRLTHTTVVSVTAARPPSARSRIVSETAE